MAKKIDFPAMGEEKQIWFNIGRLQKVEELLGVPIGEIMQTLDKLNIKYMVVFLRVGMMQEGFKSEQYWQEKMDEAFDNGFTLNDIQTPIMQAIVASGLLGEAAYNALFPNEAMPEKSKN